MRRLRRAAVVLAIAALAAGSPVLAQAPGGVLRATDFDSPASMSPLAEATVSVAIPVTAGFNNLVMFDQHKPQNSIAGIVPDLAQDWRWNADGTSLTMQLRRGVKWHDGRPFTAADVKCTRDLLQRKAEPRLRVNPRLSWYPRVKGLNIVENSIYNGWRLEDAWFDR